MIAISRNKLSLRSKTMRGLTWSFTGLVSKQTLQLIIQIFLARMLIPEHFGLIGMITIFIALSTSLVQSGMDQALIREKNPSKSDLSTVFYFNLVISIVIYLILFFSAPIISAFFNEPQLTMIIRVLMFIIILNAIAAIQRVILIREINFRTLTLVSVYSIMLSGIIAIFLAFLGCGVWSLVAQIMLTQFFEVILLLIHNRWMPSFTFNYSAFSRFFGFGYRLLISGLIDTIYKNLYFVIIGRLYPVELLGYYTNASRLRDASSQSVTSTIQRVTYPVLSSIKENNEKLSDSYKKVLRMSGYLIFPAMLGLAAVSSNFIPLLLGEKWLPSVVYFQMLSVAGMLYPIHAINLNILKVKGRSDLFLKLEIIKKSILTFLIVIAVILNTGIEGLIGAAIASSYISLYINIYYSRKEINYSFIEQIKDLSPSFASAWIMAISVYLLNNVLSGKYFIDLTIQIISGVILYVLLSYILRIEEFKMIRKVVLNKVFKKH